jgi:hypothetical protein
MRQAPLLSILMPHPSADNERQYWQVAFFTDGLSKTTSPARFPAMTCRGGRGNIRVGIGRIALMLLRSLALHSSLLPWGPCSGHGAGDRRSGVSRILARPGELATVPINHILTAHDCRGDVAGKIKVYVRALRSCHGDDLKGIPDESTPDLIDGEWYFSGDDLPSGGNARFHSEWTVRCGIRLETIRMLAAWTPTCSLTIRNTAPKRIPRSSAPRHS